MKDLRLYKDIATRTNGDIYIGVVGPVRTGKSTFIKNFMEKFVIPNIKDENRQERAIDELPQSAAGRTIMTTEPKFIPNESVEISLDNNVKMKTRLVDCVGYLVDSAVGHMEDGQPRMVKTPWSEEEIPFVKAAEIGTEKVIKEHSTIGLVVTTDGSITDIPREDYVEAENRVISELKEINKPFVVLLNSTHPEDESTKRLADELSSVHDVPVIPMDIANMDNRDLSYTFERVLDEFPVTEIGFRLPAWFSILDIDNWLKQDVINIVKNSFSESYSLREIKELISRIDDESDIFDRIEIDDARMEDGTIKIRMDINSNMFYKILSEISNLEITSDGDIFKLLKEFSRCKSEYDKIAMALEANNPIDSLENAQYTDNKTDKSISIVERVSSNIDEANLITDKITVHKLIENLEKRDKEIILLRFYKEKTQDQVAKILGISQVQVSRIEKKILQNMKEKLVC